MELAKPRAYGKSDDFGCVSAIKTLHFGLNVVLRLFAPFLPYITDEIWSWQSSVELKKKSVHIESWPNDSDFINLNTGRDLSFVLEVAINALSAINKYKTSSTVSLGTPLEDLTLAANQETAALLNEVEDDVMRATKVKNYSIVFDESLDTPTIQVREGRILSERSI